MKTKLITGLLLAGVLTVKATLFSSPTLNAVIPDNDPSGYVNTIAVSGLAQLITSVSVQLDIAGGYNGDYYAYVTYDGQLVTLLNRVGTGGGNTYGYSDAGLNISLADGAANGNIHNYQNVANYATLISNGSQFTPDSGGATFAGAYGNLNPNGTWALFIADLSAGSQGTLVSWSLDITAVPEPVGLALGMFAALLSALVGARFFAACAAARNEEQKQFER